ncbi:MAG: hypothetical protein DWQ19_12305 [Crenarchaeota archaeon]|nr:MAG: hypothetical protein DWQ19_12305 [Thermoproteota archaeon]
MNLIEFNELYGSLSVKETVTVKCLCGQENKILKEKALDNIAKNENYICRSCAIKDHSVSEDTREKISRKLIGISRSAETREKMSQAKKEFYQTERGKACKELLSKKGVLEQAQGRLKGFHRRGYFHSDKNNQDLYYGSSYELRALYLLENNESVKSFRTQIPIQIENRHRCLDVLVEYNDNTTEILEVKPKKRLNEESIILQINDAQNYAQSKNFNFRVWTEDDSELGEYKDILYWAERYIYKTEGLDIASLRKKKASIKTQKHYKKHIKNDKITVFCDFCKEEHTIMKLSYNQNVAKNGRYICIKENGSLVGKKPKLHLRKENPYAKLGQKQCTGCGEVLDYSCFGKDKSRRDGYASRCKECRNTL